MVPPQQFSSKICLSISPTLSPPSLLPCYYTSRLYITVICTGRAITQAVSLRLPNAAARVREQVRLFGLCGGQSGIGAGLLQVLRFSQLILIPPTAPHSSSTIIQGWYSRPLSCQRNFLINSHSGGWSPNGSTRHVGH
jgi:hypothetical protein